MKNKKQNLQTILKKNAVSLDEVFGNLTPEQEKIIEIEIRYYDVLVQLKQLRKQMGYTQAQLAKKADIPRTTITKIESGSHNPTVGTLMLIASAMDRKLQVNFL